jgi:DNA (cytosine-5)-methyltransferase 1
VRISKKIKVAELFAGVGGFRLGLEGPPVNDGVGNSQSDFKVVFSNQWEPSTRRQHASEVYEARFGAHGHCSSDIATVSVDEIPEHDLLVGGFPCQDYSVATSLRNSKGLKGKKGVLWWQIERIIREFGDKAPNYLMLENVDRLLKSPANQRGRDFAVMLVSLGQLGYAVEWRVINAADYGMPQRRRRVFIMAYREGSKIFEELDSLGMESWIRDSGIIQKAFPASIRSSGLSEPEILRGNLHTISENFNYGSRKLARAPFENSGVYHREKFLTYEAKSIFNGNQMTLGDVLSDLKDVPGEFIISKDRGLADALEHYENIPIDYIEQVPVLKKWIVEKGSKKRERVSKEGVKYVFAEGKMNFPDSLDIPSRTIITAEGGGSPSRFKHVVFQNGVLRRLTPVELERLNLFPDNHTLLKGISDTKRAFFMGNALVVGVVKKLGVELALRLNNSSKDETSPRS